MAGGKGGVTLAIFILLAAGLFFIPEIIHFQRSLRGVPAPTATPSPDEQEELVDSIKETERTTEGGSGTITDNVLDLGDTRGKEKLTSILGKIETGEVEFEPPPSEVDIESLPPEKREVAMILRKEKIVWGTLNLRPVRRVIASVQREALAMIKELPLDAKRARTALLNYSNALSAMVKGESKVVDPKDYLEYLTALDQEVTLALEEDRVQEPTYRRWRSATLVPILDQSTASMRLKYAPPFTVDLVLTGLDLRYQPVNKRSAHSVRVTGVVNGIAATEVKLLQNRVLINSTLLVANAERKGFSFAIPPFVGDPLFTLRVTDEFGRYLSKSYRFIKRGGRFMVDKATRRYVIPPLPRFGPREIIPRTIDNAFRVGGASGSALIPSASGNLISPTTGEVDSGGNTTSYRSF